MATQEKIQAQLDALNTAWRAYDEAHWSRDLKAMWRASKACDEAMEALEACGITLAELHYSKQSLTWMLVDATISVASL